MNDLKEGIQHDIEVIGRISIIPAILEMMCKGTGLGFAAVARVTPERWVACGVKDDIQFGLLVGGELKVDTTICHEIRQSGQAVIIDHVAKDEFYCLHHTPAQYGFQSYISMPIIRRDNTFFGTLCAIDPSPAILNTPEVIDMFKVYADLISFHLNAAEQLPDNKVSSLERYSSEELAQRIADMQPFAEEAQLRRPRTKEFAMAMRLSNSKIRALIGELNRLM